MLWERMMGGIVLPQYLPISGEVGYPPSLKIISCRQQRHFKGDYKMNQLTKKRYQYASANQQDHIISFQSISDWLTPKSRYQMRLQQDSPPARPEKVYHLPRSKHSLSWEGECTSVLVREGAPVLGGGRGYICPGAPPPLSQDKTWDTTLDRTSNRTRAYPSPPSFEKCPGSRDQGYPLPPPTIIGQTGVKTLSSYILWNAGGN